MNEDVNNVSSPSINNGVIGAPEESHANKVLIVVLVVAVVLVVGLIWLGRSFGPTEPAPEGGASAPSRELTAEEQAALEARLNTEPARELTEAERAEIIQSLGGERSRELTELERAAIMERIEAEEQN